MVYFTKMSVAQSIMALSDQSNMKCKDVEGSSIDWCKVIYWRNNRYKALCSQSLLQHSQHKGSSSAGQWTGTTDHK
jgi:hypothetical protein